MSNQNRKHGKIVNLKDLGAHFEHLRNQLPTVGELKKEFTDLDQMIEQKLTMVSRIEQGVADIIESRKAARAWVNTKEGLARKIATAAVEENMSSTERYLKEYFEIDDIIFSTAAKKAYVLVALSEEFKTPEEAKEALVDLEDRGLLKQCPVQNPAAIKIGYQSYILDINLDVEERKEVHEPIVAFSKIIMQLVHQRRQQDTKEMNERADISLDELLDGKAGECVIRVPAESYEKDGKEMWRGGGHVNVKSDGKLVWPLKGVGSLESAIAFMKEANLSLTLNMVSFEKVPDFFKLKEFAQRKLGMSEEDATKHANKQRALWYLFDRAIREQQVQRDTAEAREEFKKSSKATASQFFGLEESSAEPAMLEFAGVFKTNTSAIHNPFLLAKQEGVEVEIIAVSPHAEDLLGKYVGKKFPSEDTYRKCPPALGRVLRAILGQTDMAKTTAITATTAE